MTLFYRRAKFREVQSQPPSAVAAPKLISTVQVQSTLADCYIYSYCVVESFVVPHAKVKVDGEVEERAPSKKTSENVILLSDLLSLCYIPGTSTAMLSSLKPPLTGIFSYPTLPAYSDSDQCK